jgi:hypothetical protein
MEKLRISCWPSDSLLWILAEIAALACTGCTLPAQAGDGEDGTETSLTQTIIDGEIDDGDPAVVALVANDQAFCTGVVITPRLVLTAGHCSLRWPTEVRFGSNAMSPDLSLAVSRVIMHPAFALDTLANDIGLVVLADPAPYVLSELGSSAASLVGAPVRIAGYGSVGARGSDAGRKRQGSSHVVEDDPTKLRLAAQPESTCEGDSGGPVFFSSASREQLVAITSAGDFACENFSTATRVDAYRDFIDSYTKTTGDAVQSAGERCFHAQNCRSGECYESASADGFPYCSAPCESSADCEATLECVAGSCRYAVTSPGAFGAECSSNEDCSSGLCAASGICSVRCLPGGIPCPAGGSCESAGHDRFTCIPERAAPASAPGCRFRVGDTPPTSVAPAFLLLLVACSAARRGARLTC